MKDDPTRLYICPETVGVHCLNFGVVYNSPSRSQMMGSHLTSKLVIEEPEPVRIQSGGEHEFGKYTTCVKMPANGRIIDVVERYPRGVGEGSIGSNPETLVIFENDETHQLDYFVIPYFTSHHQYFGYKNRFMMNNLNQLVPGNFVKKGTIFAHSPGLGPYNNYMYGRNLNLALMSWPGTAEDGIIISRDVLHKFRFKIFETRTIGFGSNTYPLLVYGDKPFPEIGENVRDDGLLMAFRTYDEDLAPVEMGIHDMKNISHTFDKALYAREAQSDVGRFLADGSHTSLPGRIIDVKVIKNNETQRNLPLKLAEYFEKYARANKKFYQRILNTLGGISLEQKKKYKDGKLNLSGLLHSLLVEARGVTNAPHQDGRVPLTLMVNQNPVDEYLITFVVEYEITPNIGYKLSGLSGDKGTIVSIREPHEMPVDKSGNRADIVMCPASTVKRSNLARLIAPELGASARETSTKLRQMLGYTGGVDPYEYVKSVNEEVFRVAYDYLLGFYNVTSETQYSEACGHNLQDRQELMGDILKEGIYMCMPIDNPKNITDTILALKQLYPYTYDTVTYIGLDGKPTESKDKVLIGPIYTIILDKIADTWSAVSTGKLQHFGVLSPRTKADKTTLPFRETPVRTIGATEGRIFAAYAGREALAEQMDRSNSPRTQRNIAYNILAAANPGNIDEVVDREYIPYGNTRPIQLVSHIISAAGGRITYQSEHVTPKQEFFEPAYTNIQNKKKP